MTAITANTHRDTRPFQQCETPLKAGAKIPTGAIVMIAAATGLAENGANTAGLVLPGIGFTAADNTTGAAGAESVLVARGMAVQLGYSGADPAVGSTVYVADNNTVALSTSQSVGAMKVLEVDTTAKTVWVWVPEWSVDTLHKDLDTAGTSITALQAMKTIVAGASGLKLVFGTQATTGSAVVATGLSTITGFGAVLGADASADATTVTATAADGNLTLKVWKPTGAADTTPTAALVEKPVAWWAIGTVAA